MSQSIIHVVVTPARLCADPRINEVGSGKVANLRLAANFSSKEDGEWVEKPLFFDCDIWRGADTIEAYFFKGSAINVSGQLGEREWTDSGGNARKTLEIKNADWSFPPKNGDGETPAAASHKQAAKELEHGPVNDDDIPF